MSSVSHLNIDAAAQPIPNTQQQRRFRPAKPIPYAIAIGPLLLFSLWTLASAAGWLSPQVLSSPWRVLATGLDLWQSGELWGHLRTSAWRAFSGLAIGVTAGSLFALLSGLTRTGEALIDGILHMKRAVPTLALIPLLILWFGIGEPMKLAIIALGATVQTYVHTHEGLRAIDARFVELAQTLRLSHWQFVRYVALPGAIPQFLLGLRLAFTASLLSLVVVEQINATSGIGYMMSLARSYGQTDRIVLGLVIYAVLGLLSDGLLRLVERRALVWRKTLSH